MEIGISTQYKFKILESRISPRAGYWFGVQRKNEQPDLECIKLEQQPFNYTLSRTVFFRIWNFVIRYFFEIRDCEIRDYLIGILDSTVNSIFASSPRNSNAGFPILKSFLLIVASPSKVYTFVPHEVTFSPR